MNRFIHPLFGYPAAALSLLAAVARSPRWLALDHRPNAQHEVPADFFGVNVAPGDDPGTENYIVERLSELGLRQVRMDYSYNSPQGAAQQLLERLLGEGYQVLLNVFPPLTEAEILHEDVEAQQRWCNFLRSLFALYHDRVDCFEIGNTPNRGRWSGFSARSFLQAWHLAQEEAGDFELTLAGPNVSDFEPLYNASFLSMMTRMDSAPEVHTDNLFVERVIEPEAYDHRVLGKLAAPLLKLNLIKKARVLASIGESVGCSQFLCTYTCWTSKRLARRSAWPEHKQADYLVRYFALAASSGALGRVYWGPLICHRDGLIDDGAEDYPVIDQVSFYERVSGRPNQFTITPAYRTLANCASRLAGSRCLEARHDPEGLSLFSYQTMHGNHFLLAWCRDGGSFPLSELLSGEELQRARFSDPLGQPLSGPVAVNEHPLYIDLPGRWSGRSGLHPEHAPTVHLSVANWQSVDRYTNNWIGAAMLRAAQQQEDLDAASQLEPEQLAELEELDILRDARNRLWTIRDPRGSGDKITVKLNRVKGLKQFTYRFRPSKGRRHWNNACNMLRRGIRTPRPIAFYESTRDAGIRDSWYLCEFVPDAFSAREVYRAFRDGANEYQGRDKAAWFDLLSGFVCNMHNKQIVHRDLSSGNLMLAMNDAGEVQPQLIDIGRAWIWSGPGSRVRDRHRLQDLIRIAYKLDWEDRQLFIQHYEAHLGKALSPLWRIPFHYYDSKQALKKTLKGKRRKRTRG